MEYKPDRQLSKRATRFPEWLLHWACASNNTTYCSGVRTRKKKKKKKKKMKCKKINSKNKRKRNRQHSLLFLSLYQHYFISPSLFSLPLPSYLHLISNLFSSILHILPHEEQNLFTINFSQKEIRTLNCEHIYILTPNNNSLKIGEFIFHKKGRGRGRDRDGDGVYFTRIAIVNV